MRKNIFYLIVVGMAILMPLSVDAECSYQDQTKYNKEASNVKTDYTVKTRQVSLPVTGEEGATDTFDVKYFEFNIYNVTANLRLSVSENGGLTKDITISDVKDGKVSFEVPDSFNITKYKISVYATQGDCSNELLREMNIVVPKINLYANYQICEEAKGFYLCQEYINTDEEIGEDDFFQKAESYMKKIAKEKDQNGNDQNGNFFNKTLDFLANNWYYIASGAILVGMIITIIIVLIRRRRVI